MTTRPTKWITNDYACKIQKEITNLREIFALDLNLKRVFKAGATSFDQFDPKSAIVWEPLFQIFVKFGEDLLKESNDKKISKRTNSNNEPIQFFIEPVISNKDSEILGVQVCGYTLFILVKGTATNVDVGEVWENLVNKAKDFNTKSKEDVKSYKKNHTRENISKFQKWMLIENEMDLAKLHDAYVGHFDATTTGNLMNTSSVSNKNNPVSCNKMFGIREMFKARACRFSREESAYDECITEQSAANVKNYIRLSPDKKTFIMSFPQAKFVMKIPPSCFTVESIMGSMFLSQQKKHMEVIPMLPTILDCYQRDNMFASGLQQSIVTKDNRLIRQLPKEDVDALTANIYNISINEDDKSEREQNLRHLQLILDGRTNGDTQPEEEEDPQEMILQEIVSKKSTAQIDKKRQSEEDKGMEYLDKLFEDDDICGENDDDMDGEDNIRHSRESNGSKTNKRESNQIATVTAYEMAETLSRYGRNVEFDDSLEGFASEYSSILFESKRNQTAIYKLSVAIMKGKINTHNIIHKKEVIRQLTLMSQLSAFHGYERCRLPNGNLSEYERAVYKAIKEDKLYEHTFTTKKFDLSLSTYATLECEQYMKLEQIYLTVDKHREAHLAWMMALDASRKDWDMHANLCLVSRRGNTGKSFVYDVVYEQRIPGTAELETDRSEKAHATDERNKSGGVIIQHEVKRGDIMEDKTGKSNRHAYNKEIMGSGHSRSRRLVKNADGTFTQKLTDTDTICVQLWATNLDVESIMDHALKTRVHIIHVEESGAFERSLLELKMAESIMTDNEKLARKVHNTMCQQIQALDFEINRLIWLGGLHSVSMHVAMIFNIRFDHELKKKNIMIPSRTYSRVCILSQKRTIQRAIVNTFYSPASKFYGKPIELKSLLAVDRMLFCTIEDVVASVGTLLDGFIDPAVDNVLMILRAKHQDNTNSIQYKQTKEDVDKIDPTYVEIGYKGNYNSFCEELSDFSTTDSRCIPISPEGVARGIKKLKVMREKTRKFRFHPENKNRVIEDKDSNFDNRIVLEVKPKKIFLLYTKVMGELRTQRDEIVDIIKSILQYDHQYPKKVLFDNDKRRPYIRNFIEIEKTDGNGLLSIPTPVQITSAAKAVLQDDAGYFDSYKEAEFTCIDVDIDTHGMCMRNELLGITETPIPKGFVDVNCFVDNDTQGGVDGANKNKKSAREKLLDSSDHDPNKAYFMGDSLESYFEMKDIKNVGDVSAKIASVYKHLDKVAESIHEDYDFDPSEFIVRNDKDGNPIYHWQLLKGELSNPNKYKLICYHPFIIDHFNNVKCYDNEETRKHMISYPEDFIEEATKERTEKWDKAIKFCSHNDRTDLVDQLKGGIKYYTYELDKNKNDAIRSSNVYVDLETLAYSENDCYSRKRHHITTPIHHSNVENNLLNKRQKTLPITVDLTEAEPEPERAAIITTGNVDREDEEIDIGTNEDSIVDDMEMNISGIDFGSLVDVEVN